MTIIDRTSRTAGVFRTMNGRNIFSGGRQSARRSVSAIDAIMLHQTDFLSASIDRFDCVIANYIVMQDGRVLMVRPLDHALNSIGTNQRAIDIEFVGDYPGDRAVRGGGAAAGPTPPLVQIKAGRELVRFLKGRHGIGNIFAHAQFRTKNCPGPHLWYNVGEWAVSNGFRCNGRGNRIRRTWQDPSLAIV